MTLRRRICLALAVFALGACDPVGGEDQPAQFDTPVERLAVSPDARVMVVYVGAANCPDCRAWEAGKSALVERWEAARVEYRESISPKYSNTASPSYWPEDIRWITTGNAAFVARGTPRFLVLVDGQIVRNKYGAGASPEAYVDRVLAARSGRPVAPDGTGRETADSGAPEPRYVALSCRLERDQATLALEPGPGVQINAEYGVSVAPSEGDRTAWGVRLPYVHRADGSEYFTGAVNLSLPIAKAGSRPSLHVDYGYCAKGSLCMTDKIEVACN